MFSSCISAPVCYLLQNKSITCCWCTVRLFHLINNINIAVLLVIRLDMRWQESWLFVLSAERECWHDTVSWRWLMLSDMNPSRDDRGLSRLGPRASRKERIIYFLTLSILFFFLSFHLKKISCDSLRLFRYVCPRFFSSEIFYPLWHVLWEQLGFLTVGVSNFTVTCSREPYSLQ